MSKQVLPVRIDRITIPEFVERTDSKVRDDLLRKSIEQGGIQQPLVLVPYGDSLLLAKGRRRLLIARALGHATVPAVLEPAPDGVDPETHARRLRFVLTFHRQDLVPSQKGEIVHTLKERFGMTNAAVAAYLGIAPDSVTNWLSVKHYIPAVVAAMDANALTMNAARVFDGMTEEGQRDVWKKHGKQLLTGDAFAMHRELRAKYPPDLFPRYYRQPELIAQRLATARKQGRRKSTKRRGITSAEKRRLLNSVDLRETELRDGKEELKRLKAEIQAAIVPIGAILRNDELLARLPEEIREEFQRFGEVYC